MPDIQAGMFPDHKKQYRQNDQKDKQSFGLWGSISIRNWTGSELHLEEWLHIELPVHSEGFAALQFFVLPAPQNGLSMELH
ncbi:hypothetical protein D7D25_14985 [Proteiniphilum sp. X52]|nr:hypothetical protein D7D25_14985 [Proteiniphilum sp. X52]